MDMISFNFRASCSNLGAAALQWFKKVTLSILDWIVLLLLRAAENSVFFSPIPENCSELLFGFEL